MKIRYIFLFVLSLILLLSLTSCIIIPTFKRYKIDAEEVFSIEIYDLRSSDTHGSDFLETQAPAYVIEEQQITDFLGDLSDIRFSDTVVIAVAAVDPSFSYGDWVVRIRYTDGSCALISCNGYGETYDASGAVIDTNHFGCDGEEWEEFVSKYVPNDILKGTESSQ